MTQPTSLARRTVGEWTLHSDHAYERPFVDVRVTGTFTAPDGRTLRHPGFFDGDGTWRVRFSPDQPGEWQVAITSLPANEGLAFEGSFTVTERETRGFLRSTPDAGVGFTWEDGTPLIPLGDTVYNLFGWHVCDMDVRPFLERRLQQGFNILRARVPVSPFHPHKGFSDWQTKRTLVWGGSETAPQFFEFDLSYFRKVDEVVQMASEVGIGFEMIMEAWGFEFPWNDRQIFNAEWEQLYLTYILARYDAYDSVLFWTPLNEYEFYPNGDWSYNQDADLWLMRIGRMIKETAAHGHPVAAHNGPRLPAFASRFGLDPDVIDTIMFQEWGDSNEEMSWLAGGIEEIANDAFEGWWGSRILAEWGYEMTDEFPRNVGGHEYLTPEHTRRGAYRGLFMGMGITHGFEHTWGPWAKLDTDQAGMTDLLTAYRFATEAIPFLEMRPAPELLAIPDETEKGYKPRALATDDRATVAVYLPVGGSVTLTEAIAGEASWFDPRHDAWQDATASDDARTYTAPSDDDPRADWVLIIGGKA